MRATRAGLGLGAGMAAIAVVVLVLPGLASAGFVFLATPPYGPYGGHTDLGHHVFSATGTGANTIVAGPAFTLHTGSVTQQQNSSSVAAADHQLGVWSGVRNISFSCLSSRCAAGNYTTTIDWNVSWSSRLVSSCPAGVGATLYARTFVYVFGEVLDQSTSPASVVGSGSTTIYLHTLAGPGLDSAGQFFKTYPIVFPLALTVGTSYTVLTFIYAKTTALSTGSSAASACASSAEATVGGPNSPTYLDSIRVA